GEKGPRQVGRVMALWGGGVAWWRVIHADGSFLAGHEREALARYLEEGTPLRRTRDGAGSGVDMRRARWLPPAGAPGRQPGPAHCRRPAHRRPRRVAARPARGLRHLSRAESGLARRLRPLWSTAGPRVTPNCRTRTDLRRCRWVCGAYRLRVAKKAAMSGATSSGSSAGAKWPPRGITVQRRMSYSRSAHSFGGSPSGTSMCGKAATAVGTWTTSAGPSRGSPCQRRLSW